VTNNKKMSGKHTAMSALLPATALWTVIMTIPLVLWYIESAYFRIFTYMLYPVLIGLISRIGYFWVAADKIILISILTFLLGFLLNLNKGNHEAMKKPREHKIRSGLIFTTLTLTFLILLFSIGKLTYIYNPSNFGTST